MMDHFRPTTVVRDSLTSPEQGFWEPKSPIPFSPIYPDFVLWISTG